MQEADIHLRIEWYLELIFDIYIYTTRSVFHNLNYVCNLRVQDPERQIRDSGQSSSTLHSEIKY